MIQDDDAAQAAPDQQAAAIPDYISERGAVAVDKFKRAFGAAPNPTAAYHAYFKAKGEEADALHEHAFGMPYHGATTQAGQAATGGSGKPREATWDEAAGETAADVAWNAPVVGNINRLVAGIPQSAQMMAPQERAVQTTPAQNIALGTARGAYEMATMAPAMVNPLTAGAAFGAGEFTRPGPDIASTKRVVPSLIQAGLGVGLGVAGGVGAGVANRLVDAAERPVANAVARYAAELGLGAAVGGGMAAAEGGNIGEAAATGALQFGIFGLVGRAHRMFKDSSLRAEVRGGLEGLEKRPEPTITETPGVKPENAAKLRDAISAAIEHNPYFKDYADFVILPENAAMPGRGRSPIDTGRSEGGKRILITVHEGLLKLEAVTPDILNIAFTHEGVHALQEIEDRAKPGGSVDRGEGKKPEEFQQGLWAEQEAVTGAHGRPVKELWDKWMAEARAKREATGSTPGEEPVPETPEAERTMGPASPQAPGETPEQAAQRVAERTAFRQGLVDTAAKRDAQAERDRQEAAAKRVQPGQGRETQQRPPATPTGTPDKAILKELAAGPKHVDELTDATGFPVFRLSAQLPLLEQAGKVRRTGTPNVWELVPPEEGGATPKPETPTPTEEPKPTTPAGPSLRGFDAAEARDAQTRDEAWRTRRAAQIRDTRTPTAPPDLLGGGTPIEGQWGGRAAELKTEGEFGVQRERAPDLARTTTAVTPEQRPAPATPAEPGTTPATAPIPAGPSIPDGAVVPRAGGGNWTRRGGKWIADNGSEAGRSQAEAADAEYAKKAGLAPPREEARPTAGEAAPAQAETPESYVRKIRNPAKRAYADRILKARRAGQPDPPSPPIAELSPMAAQGVRMGLDGLGLREAEEAPAETSAETAKAAGPVRTPSPSIQTRERVPVERSTEQQDTVSERVDKVAGQIIDLENRLEAEGALTKAQTVDEEDAEYAARDKEATDRVDLEDQYDGLEVPVEFRLVNWKPTTQPSTVRLWLRYRNEPKGESFTAEVVRGGKPTAEQIERFAKRQAQLMFEEGPRPRAIEPTRESIEAAEQQYVAEHGEKSGYGDEAVYREEAPASMQGPPVAPPLSATEEFERAIGVPEAERKKAPSLEGTVKPKEPERKPSAAEFRRLWAEREELIKKPAIRQDTREGSDLRDRARDIDREIEFHQAAAEAEAAAEIAAERDSKTVSAPSTVPKVPNELRDALSTFTRSTPEPDSLERQTLDADARAADAERTRAEEAYRKAEKVYQKTPRAHNKKRDAAQREEVQMREASNQIRKRTQEILDRRRTALFEDSVSSGSEVQRISALARLREQQAEKLPQGSRGQEEARKFGQLAWKTVGEMVDAEARKLGAKEDELEFVRNNVVPSIMSYSGAYSLSDVKPALERLRNATRGAKFQAEWKEATGESSDKPASYYGKTELDNIRDRFNEALRGTDDSKVQGVLSEAKEHMKTLNAQQEQERIAREAKAKEDEAKAAATEARWSTLAKDAKPEDVDAFLKAPEAIQDHLLEATDWDPAEDPANLLVSASVQAGGKRSWAIDRGHVVRGESDWQATDSGKAFLRGAAAMRTGEHVEAVGKNVGNPPKAVKDDAGRVKAMTIMAHKGQHRYALNGVYVGKGITVTTDGRRIAVYKGELTKPGLHAFTSKGALTGEQVEGHFPPFVSVIHKSNPIAKAKVADLWKLAETADRAMGKGGVAEGRDITVVLNEDGTLGVIGKRSDGKIKPVTVGVKPGYKDLVSINDAFLLEALDWHSMMGDERVGITYTGPNNGFQLEGSSGKTLSVTMPVGPDDNAGGRTAIADSREKITIPSGEPSQAEAPEVPEKAKLPLGLSEKHNPDNPPPEGAKPDADAKPDAETKPEAAPSMPAPGEQAPPTPDGPSSALALTNLQRKYVKNLGQDVKENAQAAARGVVGMWDSILKVFSPTRRGEDAKTMGGIVRENAARMDLKAVQAKAALKKFGPMLMDPAVVGAPSDLVLEAAKGFKAVTGRDLTPEQLASVEFVNRYEHAEAQNTPDVTEAAGMLRGLLKDNRVEINAKTGKLEEFIENYLGRGYKDEPPDSKVMSWRDIQAEVRSGKSPLAGHKDIFKQRTYPFLVDAIARGRTPVEWNPIDMQMIILREGHKFLMAHDIMTEAEEHGYRHEISATERPEPGYTKINDPVGTIFAKPSRKGAIQIEKYIVMPDRVANILNNYLSPGLKGNPVFEAYRTVGSILNQAQLGFSAFHGMFSIGETIVSKTALGIQQLCAGQPVEAFKSLVSAVVSPVTTPIEGYRFRRYARNPKAYPGNPEMEAMLDAWLAGGNRVDTADSYTTGYPGQFWQAMREGRFFTAGLKATPALIETMAKPLMQWLIPNVKAGVFMDMARFEMTRMPKDATRDQFREVMGGVTDSVDNRLGQMIYDNRFWNKVAKDLMHGGIRSVGWNVGTLGLIGGGIKDLLVAPVKIVRGQQFMTRNLAYVTALPIVMGLAGAIIHKLSTGKDPEGWKDYYAPQTGGTDPAGNPERIQLASYMKDMIAYGRHPLATLTNKLHPIGSAIASMLNNKDYFGDEIRNPDAPVTRQMAQLAAFAGKQFEPFSVNYAVEQAKRGQSVGTQAGAFFGVMPAARELVRTPAQNLAARLQLRPAPPEGWTPEQADIRDYRHQLSTALQQGKSYEEAAKSIPVPEDIRPTQIEGTVKRAAQDPRIAMFHALDAKEAQQVYAIANPDERALWGPILDEKVLRARAQDALAQQKLGQAADPGEIARARAITRVMGAVSRVRGEINKGRVDRRAGEARIKSAIEYLKERIAQSEGAGPQQAPGMDRLIQATQDASLSPEARARAMDRLRSMSSTQ